MKRHLSKHFNWRPYPERLRSVSIGAPGAVSLIDEGRDWWVGTAHAGISVVPYVQDFLLQPGD